MVDLEETDRADRNGLKARMYDPSSWTEAELEDWMRGIQLDEAPLRELRSRGISGLELLALDDADLAAVGVKPVRERTRVLRELQQLRFRSRRSIGTAESQRFVSLQRGRSAVLTECMETVLLQHCPQLPLKLQRLLLALWQVSFT